MVPKAATGGGYASVQLVFPEAHVFLDTAFDIHYIATACTRLIPTRVEFWKGRENRIHDRICYVREGTPVQESSLVLLRVAHPNTQLVA